MSELSFIPISPLTLSSQFAVGVDIYWLQADAKKPIFFLAADQIASNDSLQRLAAAPNVKLYISKEESAKFQEYYEVISTNG